MKRAQVFRKTLLSVAVVSALGGHVGLVSAASGPLDTHVFKQEQVKKGFSGVRDGIYRRLDAYGNHKSDGVDRFDTARKLVAEVAQLERNAFRAEKPYQIKIIQAGNSLKAAQDALTKVNPNDLDDIAQKRRQLDSATKEFDNAKAELASERAGHVRQVFDRVKRETQGELVFEEESLVPVDSGRAKVTSSASGSTAKVPAQDKVQNNVRNTTRAQVKADPVYQATPGSDIAPRAKVPGTPIALDGAQFGANVPIVRGKDEDKAHFHKRVDDVANKIKAFPDEKVRPVFMTEQPVPGQKGKTEWVPSESAAISNFDFTNPTIKEALSKKIIAATKLDGGEPDLLLFAPEALVFRNDKLILDNIHNTYKTGSVINDVSSSVDGKTDPAGHYALKGSGSLYHEYLGMKRPLKQISVEGQQLEMSYVGKVQHVKVSAGGSISGYIEPDQKDPRHAKNEAIADYARLEAARPDDDARASVHIVSDAVQRANYDNFDEIHFAGKELYSQSLSAAEVRFDRGSVIFGAKRLVDKGENEGIAASTLVVAEGVVVKGVKQETDPMGVTKKVSRDVPVPINGFDVSGKKKVSESEHTINGTVYGDYEGVDSLIINGSLVTDGVGKQCERLKKLALGKESKLTRFSNDSRPVYTSNEVEYVISAGQHLVADVKGFKSFWLDGGLHEGHLQGSAAVDGAKYNKDAFQGATITLTSGTLQGGTLKAEKGIVIDGGVVFKPGVTTLPSFDLEGKPQVTKLKPSILDGDVMLTAKARPEIHKTYKDEGGKLATPVKWSKNATMKQGAELAVNLDWHASAEDRAVPFVEVADTLTVNNNIVRASTTYEETRELYEKGGKKYAVIDAGDIQGSLAEPVIDSPFLKALGFTTDNQGRKGYGIHLTYNADTVNELKKEFNLNEEQAEAVAELEKLAQTTKDKAESKKIFEEVAEAAKDNTLKQLANESTQNEVINGGLAQSALTVQRKVNEGIGRRLDHSRTGISTGDMFESQGFWGQYLYSDGSLDTKNDIPGFDAKINGITIGADVDLNQDFTAGLAFSYAKSKLTNKGVSGETKSDTYVGSVYGGWNYGSYFFDGVLSYAGNRNDIERGFLGRSFKADSVKGSMWGARIVGGYMHNVQQWVLQPQAALNYSSFKLDEFSENDGPERQQVKVNDYDVMELGFGLKIFGEFDAGRGTIKPEASFMYFHDFKDDKPAGSYRYVDSPLPQFEPIHGADREQNRYALGLGASYAMDNNLSFGLNYDYNWSGKYKAHGFMARVSYDF